MMKITRLLGFAAFLALGLGAGAAPARAQGWDYGRQMFGFAQYYPGSGWSSYYHPNFDPDAFFPTTFGVRTTHQATAFYAGPHTTVVPHGGMPYRAVPVSRFPGHRGLFGRRSPATPVLVGP